MAFVGIEFPEGDDGGGIALVSKEWVTPRKSEVFWPPHRNQDKYYKSLKNSELPDENTWSVYKISRKLFEIDDYEKALRKIKQAEVTSDLQSDIEQPDRRPKRKHVARKLSEDTDEDEQSELYQRPPAIKKLKTPYVTKINDQQITIAQRTTDSRVITTPSSCVINDTPTSSHSTPSTSRCLSVIDDTDILKEGSSNQVIIKLLTQIKAQNTQILQRMNKQNVVLNSINLPEIPVALPLKREEELNILENFLVDRDNSLTLCSYLSTLGGRDTTSLTNNILKRCLTNELASTYSFRGKGKKKAFSDLCLNNVVLGAVKNKNPESSERDIEDHIKVWLKHSPQRYKVDRAKGRKENEASQKRTCRSPTNVQEDRRSC